MLACSSKKQIIVTLTTPCKIVLTKCYLKQISEPRVTLCTPGSTFPLNLSNFAGGVVIRHHQVASLNVEAFLSDCGGENQLAATVFEAVQQTVLLKLG